MKKFKFPFFSKHQPVVANTKQIIDAKSKKPLSDVLSSKQDVIKDNNKKSLKDLVDILVKLNEDNDGEVCTQEEIEKILSDYPSLTFTTKVVFEGKSNNVTIGYEDPIPTEVLPYILRTIWKDPDLSHDDVESYAEAISCILLSFREWDEMPTLYTESLSDRGKGYIGYDEPNDMVCYKDSVIELTTSARYGTDGPYIIKPASFIDIDGTLYPNTAEGWSLWYESYMKLISASDDEFTKWLLDNAIYYDDKARPATMLGEVTFDKWGTNSNRLGFILCSFDGTSYKRVGWNITTSSTRCNISKLSNGISSQKIIIKELGEPTTYTFDVDSLGVDINGLYYDDSYVEQNSQLDTDIVPLSAFALVYGLIVGAPELFAKDSIGHCKDIELQYEANLDDGCIDVYIKDIYDNGSAYTGKIYTNSFGSLSELQLSVEVYKASNYNHQYLGSVLERIVKSISESSWREQLYAYYELCSEA